MNFGKPGLRQGGALPPVLLNITPKMVIKETQKKCEGSNLENRRQYGILAYADDIIILVKK